MTQTSDNGYVVAVEIQRVRLNRTMIGQRHKTDEGLRKHVAERVGYTWTAAGSSSTPALMDSGKRCWVIATYSQRAPRAEYQKRVRVDQQVLGGEQGDEKMRKRG